MALASNPGLRTQLYNGANCQARRGAIQSFRNGEDLRHPANSALCKNQLKAVTCPRTKTANGFQKGTSSVPLPL